MAVGVTAAAGMAEAMPAVVVKVAEATAVGATAVAAMEEAVMAEVVPAVEMVVVTAVAMVEVTVAEVTVFINANNSSAYFIGVPLKLVTMSLGCTVFLFGELSSAPVITNGTLKSTIDIFPPCINLSIKSIGNAIF